ncbi:hypothetical protein [Nocardia gamkensis]|uniref:Uncharacterized protein n=1 Tax=Nocardia gamkensis TaxID=352869 RepID=A0A7X6LBR2_9NOCA|nr:hypothetical protein [Nocardia gamkensis]NKY31309.1 hypothetical protein [Nocardia gamkensis]
MSTIEHGENQQAGPIAAMSSLRPPRAPRTARPPEIVARLERSGVRSKQCRDLARQRERTIHEVVKRYLTDWEAITACETKRDQDIAALRQQISERVTRLQEIARDHADQADAAAVMHEHGASDDELAELLEISTKQARQLITAARSSRSATTA